MTFRKLCKFSMFIKNNYYLSNHDQLLSLKNHIIIIKYYYNYFIFSLSSFSYFNFVSIVL